MEWQGCAVTCGTGKQERTRTKEKELHGGDPCVGDFIDTRLCMPRDCPGKTSSYTFRDSFLILGGNLLPMNR